MRLFIAVNFDEQVKKDICGMIEKIEKYAVQGRFVKKEHMHLTLEFLGEVPRERVESIVSAMEHIQTPPLILSLSDLGYFKREGGDIYWLGIKENKELMDMQAELCNLLLKKGFLLQRREYRPHITIGREVKLMDHYKTKELMNTINRINIHVNSIELMKSERINGKLVHQKIHSKALE
jgi:2'-5' RNA ligase